MAENINSGAMKIVVPVPLNSEFYTPLFQAVYFQKNYGAEITVLHVINKYPFMGKMLSPRKLQKYRNRTKKRLKRMVKERFGKDEVYKHLAFKVVTGDLVSGILNFSEKNRADMIIIKKGKRVYGRKRLLQQENADRLIANSICPVLTIYKEPSYNGINKILLPVDIMKTTDNKVAWAKSMAKRFNAEIHVLSVLDMKVKQDDSLSYQKGKRIENEIRKDGIETKLILLGKSNKPKEDIVLDYAKEYMPDLLLIMTHQENIFVTKYLGSFASEIIHKAKMPVLSMIPNKVTIVGQLIDSVKEMSSSGNKATDKVLQKKEFHEYSTR